MPTKPVLAFFLMLVAAPGWAKPAPWYWWISKFDGNRVCQQTSPGDGWYRSGTPYWNSRCTDIPER